TSRGPSTTPRTLRSGSTGDCGSSGAPTRPLSERPAAGSVPGRRLLGSDDGDDLERDEVAPAPGPLAERGPVVRRHQLEAAVAALCVNRAPQQAEARREHPAARAEALVDRAGARGERLDDHVAHVPSSVRRGRGQRAGARIERWRAAPRRIASPTPAAFRTPRSRY